MDKTERQISGYSSLLIALMLNSGRLLAMREQGMMARFWQFNPGELAFQIGVQFLLCYLLFYLNLQHNRLSAFRTRNKIFTYLCLNFLLLFIGLMAGGILQRYLFHSYQIRGLYWATYIARTSLSAILVGILIKIVLLIRESKRHMQENERLKSAYTTAELQLLKAQLNPHFLFNSLSSLSGVVREDPMLAQQYINHLSKVFRYSLHQTRQLVTLEEELIMLRSFGQLLKMRFEQAFVLNINVESPYTSYKLPHLSLQPLLENAAKHNAATLTMPLLVNIYVETDHLVISNNLQPANAESNGIGLSNLNERFRILMHKEIEIVRTEGHFIVKLPLQHE